MYYDSDDSDMEGCGIFDMFIKQDDFTKSSKNTMKKFGDYPIVKLSIYRTPVVSILKSFLNVLSLGQLNKATKSYDDLFHLAMVATVELPNGTMKNIIIEKNSVPNISTSYKTNDKTQIMEVPLKKEITVNSMVQEAIKKIPTKRFFLYDAFNRNNESGNCQRFILDILSSNNLLTKPVAEFVNQDAKKILDDMGWIGKNIVAPTTRTLTDIGAIFGLGAGKSNLKLHAVIVKDLPIEEAQQIASNIIKNKNRKFSRITKSGSIRFRNIPKTAFIPKSYKTKKVNKNVSLVFGVLKPSSKYN